MSTKAHWSPVFKEKRLAWLRQRHKLPLKQRWLEVLGEGSLPLLTQLRRAYERYEGVTSEQSERYARMVLRACNKLPSTPSGMRRRLAYIHACIAAMTPSTDLTDEELEAELSKMEAQQLESLHTRFCRATGVSRDEAWKLFLKCSNLIPWGRVNSIFEKAVKAKYPLKYIAVVLRNEKQQQRLEKRAERAKSARKHSAQCRRDQADGAAQSGASESGVILTKQDEIGRDDSAKAARDVGQNPQKPPIMLKAGQLAK